MLVIVAVWQKLHNNKVSSSSITGNKNISLCVFIPIIYSGSFRSPRRHEEEPRLSSSNRVRTGHTQHRAAFDACVFWGSLGQVTVFAPPPSSNQEKNSRHCLSQLKSQTVNLYEHQHNQHKK